MDPQFYDSYWSNGHPPPDSDPTTPERLKRLLTVLRSLEGGPSLKTLDVGCGRGLFVKHMVEAGYKSSGVDISPQAITFAKETCKSGEFKTLNSDLTLPFGSGSFDLVWSSEVIEHVFDVHKYLTEINRVLKPDGTYVLTTPYHGILKNILVSSIAFSRHFDPEGSHIRFFDKAGLKRCLARAGLQAVSWQGIGRVWPLYRTWFVLARKLISGAPVNPVSPH